MKKQILQTALALLVVMLLIPITSVASTFKGTINITVGERHPVDLGFAYSTVSGNWSKSNSTFGFASKGQKSCEIYGINEGTGTLTWKGVVNADDFEYYWTVNVTSPNPGPDPTNSDNWMATGSYTTSWYDRTKSEFTLSTNQELAGLAYLVNNGKENFNGMAIRLDNDIDLSGKSWVPIGTAESNSFRGTFDGQGHMITGILIDEKSKAITQQQYYGFFGNATLSVIQNLNINGNINLVNPIVSKSIYIGGLAGYINGTVDHVTCNMEVSYDDDISVSGGNKSHLYIGGLLGHALGTIKYCKHYGSIYCYQSNADFNNGKDSASPYIGGLVGESDGIDIEYSENNSPKIKLHMPNIIYGGWTAHSVKIGGILGQQSGGGDKSTISYCRSFMMIDYTDGGLWNGASGHSRTVLGGIIGSAYSPAPAINMCYSVVPTVTTSKTGWIENTNWGGICGYFYGSYWSCNYCFSNSDVSISVANKVTSYSYDGSKTFTAAEMKTSAFLDKLNENAVTSLGKPIWEQGKDGYPAIIEPKTSVSDIAIDKTTASIQVGETLQLTSTIAPNNATDKSVTWSSSNTNIATVSNSGLVTAVAVGSATITCTANDGSGVTATCEVTVRPSTVYVSSIALNVTEKNLMIDSDPFQLVASISPDNATNKNVTWTSSDEKVAKVDVNGFVTPVNVGDAVITCKANDGSGVTATCTIHVAMTFSDVSFVSVTCDNTNLDKLTQSDKLQFHATFRNDGETDVIYSMIAVCDRGMTKIIGEGEYDVREFPSEKETTIDYKYALDTIPDGNYYATVFFYDWNEEGWFYTGDYLYEITIKGESNPDVPGDVNGDGQVNGTDLVALTNIILGKNEETSAADVNGDGKVNGTDYVALTNIILGKSKSPKKLRVTASKAVPEALQKRLKGINLIQQPFKEQEK